MKRIIRFVLIFVGTISISACASRKEAAFRDETLRIAEESAKADYAAGDYKSSEAEWMRALDRAYVLGDVSAASEIHYQLAVSALAQGRLKESRLLLRHAAAEAMSAEDVEKAARAEAAEARVAHTQGQADDARMLARQALNRLKDKSAPSLEADIHILLAASFLNETDRTPEAEKELALAIKLRGKHADPSFQAMKERVQGMIWEKKGGHSQEAADAFWNESEHWRQARNYAAQAEALYRSGKRRLDVGDWGKAAHAILKGARIDAGLRNLGRATESLEQLLQLHETQLPKDELTKKQLDSYIQSGLLLKDEIERTGAGNRPGP